MEQIILKKGYVFQVLSQMIEIKVSKSLYKVPNHSHLSLLKSSVTIYQNIVLLNNAFKR